MRFDNQTYKKILLKGDYVSEGDLKKAEEFAKKNNSSVIDYLFSQSLLNKDLLGQAIAEFLEVDYSDLNSNMPTHDRLIKIPEETAKKFRLILFAEDKKSSIVTTDDPKKEGLAEAVKAIFPKQKIVITFSLPEDIDTALTGYRKTLETRFSKIIKESQRVAPEIIDEILSDAASYKASDVHFEPQPKEVVVRFRVDGVLQEAGRIAKEYYENILNRIKVQSRLRIDQHLAAQDGSMRFKKDNLIFDLRTSVVPTVEGEKVVLRVLAAYVKGFSLVDLGLGEKHQAVLKSAAKKPFGMILVVGPTGSGKTTTLYAILKLLNNSSVNVTTIEDPVEYKVLGINQIQVNQETGLTFAKGLRSIVRQDPDVILVGEIRDTETAEIAVNAALTGHLLLSTFHSNDAATAIPRLLDMNAEPFLLASTLEVIIAQRLVRKICEHCRISAPVSLKDLPIDKKIASQFFNKEKITLYRGKGCSVCGDTGYNGRTAIFEFIQITPEMQDLILHSPSTKQIWQLAKSQGAVSLFEDGMEKVKNGITTIEELLRVAEETT
ncbi:MAG: type II/IV secretion system protein [Candidatus Buchananbacteria bacterium]|nr:type II/IV secretion system protein [Candidatus Buchananbacteria bacterium]